MQNSGGQAEQQDLMNSKHRDYSVASGRTEFDEFMGGGILKVPVLIGLSPLKFSVPIWSPAKQAAQDSRPVSGILVF